MRLSGALAPSSVAVSLAQYGVQIRLQAGDLTAGLGRLLGLAFAAASAAAVGALVYRWYVREPLPNGLAAILGVGTVAVYLNTVGLFRQVLDPVAGTEPFALPIVVSNVAALAAGVVAAPVGRVIGDRLALSLFGAVDVRPNAGVLGRVRGRLVGATAVTLPPASEIEEVAGYDPVRPSTRERLGGRTVALPRGPGPLADRLAAHLRETYGVGRVDLDVEGDRVTYLALGTRPAGIAPTLAPGTVAVPLRADPPNGAGPGDLVQVWTVDAADGPAADTARRVATAELRATVGDVVTLAVDESDTGALSADRNYRLVTLPTRQQADREFASLLSAADERMDAVTVMEGSPLVGTTVGAVDVAVAVVRTASGTLDPIPPRSRALAAGETVYVVGLPEAIRRLTARASAE